MATSANRRKILVPLASLAVAGAIVVGSGATFTSQSQNPGNSFTAGTLEQTNSKEDAAVFNLDNLKPGDTLNGSLTITNSGTLPAKFTLTETASSNGFTQDDKLTLTIKEQGASSNIWSGTFGALEDAQKLTLGGDWAAGESHTYVFTAHLDLSADNTNQGDTATAAFQWDGVQVDDGQTYNQ